MAVPAGGKGKSTFYRLPAEAGDAVFAGWASDDIGVVGSAKGQAVWFEQSEERFVPLALLTPPGEFGLHATGERNHWCVLPDPVAADKSVLLEYAMPPEGLLKPGAAVRPSNAGNSRTSPAAGVLPRRASAANPES